MGALSLVIASLAPGEQIVLGLDSREVAMSLPSGQPIGLEPGTIPALAVSL